MIVSDDRVARFVGEALGQSFVPPYTVMGIERGGHIIAGVLFNVFEGDDVHVSIAGHGWSHRFISAVGRYAFDQLRCTRITAITESAEIVRLAERLGGQIEGCLRNHFGPGRDGYIVGILKEEWKF